MNVSRLWDTARAIVGQICPLMPRNGLWKWKARLCGAFRRVKRAFIHLFETAFPQV